jgi:TPR repeat protein/uncharacterized protein YbaP (TraB family)
MFSEGRGVPRDLEQSLHWFTLAARSGLARAQHNLADAYFEGEGTPQDLKQAHHWFQRAARQGYAPSLVALGYLHERGLGVAQDLDTAVRWYRAAAETGYPVGQTYLADMYRAGLGVAADATIAMDWMRKAAAQDHPRAIYLLAEMTEQGEGVAADLDAAVRGYRRAAELGYAPAQAAMGASYADGRGLPQDDALAVQWYERAAVQQSPMALTNLGRMRMEGRGGPVDRPRAVALFRQAAEFGHALGMAELGVAYLDGLGVNADPAHGVQWLNKATKAGSQYGQFRLASAYLEGQGVPADAKAAFDLFRQNAEAGYVPGMRELGRRLEKGQGHAVDLAQAHHWYERAARAGDRDAMFFLGVMNDLGRGVPVSKGHAVYWYVRAARLGDVDERNNLGMMYLDGEFVAKDAPLALALFTLAAEDGQDNARRSRDYIKAKLDAASRKRAAMLTEALRQADRFDKALEESLAAAQGLSTSSPQATAAASCLSPAPAVTAEQIEAWQHDAPDRGPLWRITKDGRTSHLYGTIHVGRAPWLVIGPQLTQALASSDVLGLEADLNRLASGALLDKAQARMARLDKPELQSRLDAELGNECASMLRQKGVPQMMQSMLLTLRDAAAQRQHIEYGLDLLLSAVAQHRKLPMSPLENEDDAIDALLQAYEAGGVSRLRAEMAIDAPRRAAILRRVVRAWERADMADLESYARWCECVDTLEAQAMHERLNDGRNPGMAERIDALHTQGKRVLAAVGAMHMTGPKGLPALLAAKGYRVERVLPEHPVPEPLEEIRVNRAPSGLQ